MANEKGANGTMTEQELRGDLSAALDRIHDSKTPTVVVRENGKELVILSKKEYDSWMETLYILNSPKTAERLDQALRQTDRESKCFNSVEELRNEFGL